MRSGSLTPAEVGAMKLLRVPDGRQAGCELGSLSPFGVGIMRLLRVPDGGQAD